MANTTTTETKAEEETSLEERVAEELEGKMVASVILRDLDDPEATMRVELHAGENEEPTIYLSDSSDATIASFDARKFFDACDRLSTFAEERRAPQAAVADRVEARANGLFGDLEQFMRAAMRAQGIQLPTPAQVVPIRGVAGSHDSLWLKKGTAVVVRKCDRDPERVGDKGVFVRRGRADVEGEGDARVLVDLGGERRWFMADEIATCASAPEEA